MSRRFAYLCALGLSLVLAAACGVSAQELSRADVSGTVLDATTHKALAAVAVTIDGPAHRTTQTDGGGNFALPGIVPGSFTFSFAAKGYAPLSKSAVTIVPGQSAVISAELAPLSQALKVIGSVRAAAGTLNVTPAAVTIVTSAQITESGIDGYRRILEQVPGVSVIRPSFMWMNDSYASWAGTPYGQVMPQIRGAQPYETAVLFDGHRLVSSQMTFGGRMQGTDISSVDPYLFDHLAVVRGPGATSPTINGAIGGTIDFLSGRPAGHPRLTVKAGDDGIGSSTLHFGAEGESANHRLGAKLALTSTATTFPDTSGSNVFVTGENLAYNNTVTPIAGGVPSGPPQRFICGSACASQSGGVPFPANDSETLPNGLVACCVPTDRQPRAYARSASALLRYDIANRTTLSALYSAGNQYTQQAYQIVPTSLAATPGYAGSLPVGIPVNYLINDLDPTSFASKQLNQIGELSLHSLAGAVAVHASYLTETPKSDLYYRYGYPAGTYTLYGVGAIGSQPAQVFNGTPVAVGAPYNAYSDVSIRQWLHDALLEFAAPVGTSNVHLSFSDSRSSGNLENAVSPAQILATDPFCGAGSGMMGATSCVSRALEGQYQDFRTERIAYDANIGRKLRSYTSVYFNQYSYHGILADASGNQTGSVDTTNGFVAPRVAFEYRPAPNLAYRASAGAGLAPLGVELYSYAPSAPSVDSSTHPTKYTVTIPPQGLRPEQSFGEDLGVDVRLRNSTTLSADFYHTLLHGQYFKNTLDSGTTFTGSFGTLPLYTTQFRNLGESRNFGLEIAIDHKVPLGLTWSLSGSLQRAYAFNIPASFYKTSASGMTTSYLVPNANFNGNSIMIGTNPVPYSQGYATLGYNAPKSSTTLGVTYNGPNNTYYLPAFFVLDLNERYRIAENTTLLATVSNLTNSYGGFANTGNIYYVLPAANGRSSNVPLYAGAVGPPALSLQLIHRLGT
jgi:outer membrane receptor protein involved in Fe transport